MCTLNTGMDIEQSTPTLSSNQTQKSTPCTQDSVDSRLSRQEDKYSIIIQSIWGSGVSIIKDIFMRKETDKFCSDLERLRSI